MDLVADDVTVVIFGAGASYGCIYPKGRPPSPSAYDKNPRDLFPPPLTAELAEDPYLLEHAGGCQRLLAMMRQRQDATKATGFDFETELKELFGAAGPEAKQEFDALRRAIGERMQVASSAGKDPGGNAYVDLFGRMRFSSRTQERRILVLNLNYDTLAQQALTDDRAPFDRWDQYYSPDARGGHPLNPEIVTTHPHGCHQWHYVPSTVGTDVLTTDDVRVEKIHRRKVTPVQRWSNDPVLALPMSGHDVPKEAWPAFQKEIATEMIASADELILIGWRGHDPEVLDLLKPQLPRMSEIHLVQHDEKSARLSGNQLGLNLAGQQPEVFAYHKDFANYVKDPTSPLRRFFSLPGEESALG